MLYQIGGHQPDFTGDGHYVAHNATIIGNVSLASNSSVWFNAVIRGDNEPIRIGANSNIQDGAVLHTDPGIPLTVGDHVTIGHQACLHGCTIGDGTLIGIKAVLLNGAVIGKNCLIGANTLISEGKVIPDNSLVVGTPGRILRTLTEQEVQALHQNAQHYIELTEQYRDHFLPVRI